jgi:hypothetical protein
MRKTAVSILSLSMLCSSATVWAAGQIKPGLWEMTIKSDAFKNIPKMPPEQLKKMREMGINIPQMQDGGMVSKVCITKEMAERDDAPQINQKESGCQSRNYQRSGTTYSLDIVCDGPDMKGTGKIKGSYAGNERFSSTYDFKGTSHGQPVNHRQESSGKWLSADCGSVKPLDQPAKKK